MKQILSQKPQEFCCEPCKYITNNKKDYNKHLLTSKHEKNTNVTELKQNWDKIPDTKKYTCKCTQTFSNRTSFWRHTKKGCNPNIESNTTIESTMMLQLIKQNEEFKTLLVEQNNKVLDCCENIKNISIMNTTNNTMTNSNNKSFNLNVFLNETCKDAMNMKDFVDSIQITLTDIENMGKLGFVNGISNIIVNRLKAIDVHLRPVHCTDQRRETMYVKEKNQWNKEDEDNKNIRRFIQLVAHKNTRNLNLFKNKHPDCLEYHSKYNDQYNKIVMETFGGYGNTDYDSENKIIRKLVKELAIDKSN